MERVTLHPAETDGRDTCIPSRGRLRLSWPEASLGLRECVSLTLPLRPADRSPVHTDHSHSHRHVTPFLHVRRLSHASCNHGGAYHVSSHVHRPPGLVGTRRGHGMGDGWASRHRVARRHWPHSHFQPVGPVLFPFVAA